MIVRTCKDCGKKFELSDSEIQFFEERNLTLPKRCQQCRKAKKFRKQQTYTESRQIPPQRVSVKEKRLRSIVGAGVVLLLFLMFLLYHFSPYWYHDTTQDADSQYIQYDAAGQNIGDTDNHVTQNTAASENTDSSFTYQFRTQENLQEHFSKHGAEFGYQTAEAYLEGANRVIVSADALHKYEKEDGDDVYYLESTNELVIVSTDNYIRTYFKPEDGIEYYNRQ
ncbi:MAG: zinc-ribbon domain containing protein [Roseburia sp.]|nr:zinc-ribbon domain containing protein [Roseburia sp.]